MNTIPAEVWHGLLALALATLTWLLGLATRWVQEHTRQLKYGGVLQRAELAVATAVGEIAQKFVDDLKAQGKFDGSAVQKAAADALALAKGYLGSKGLALLAKVLGLNAAGVDTWLQGRIETHVRAGDKMVTASPLRPVHVLVDAPAAKMSGGL